jgi:hypothetical protein
MHAMVLIAPAASLAGFCLKGGGNTIQIDHKHVLFNAIEFDPAMASIGQV